MSISTTAITYHPDLTGLDQWVCWRLEKRNGKLTKVPYNPHSGRLASSTDPSTWAPFEVALATWTASSRYNGIGFVFSPCDPFVGVDLDHCRDAETGTIDAWAQQIINDLDGYAELSPSGTGIHIWVRGHVPGERRKGEIDGHKIEMYDTGRFFTVTGIQLRARGS
jgi:primase-polymerase (primpol)-like protein